MIFQRIFKELKQFFRTRKVENESSKHYKVGDWLTFYPKFSNFSIVFDVADYEDDTVAAHICLGYGDFYFSFPFKIKHKKNQNYEAPSYGVYYFENSLVFKLGHFNKHFYMPWDYTWHRTSYMKKDSTWEHETRPSRLNSPSKNFYDDDVWKNILWRRVYPYTCNGDEVAATVKVSEMEWRPRATKRFPIFQKIRKSIDVSFSSEVGKRKGSYKGGTTGCGYNMLKGESPLACLRRMERERLDL